MPELSDLDIMSDNPTPSSQEPVRIPAPAQREDSEVSESIRVVRDLGADDGPRFKSTTQWANGAELVIEKFPAPDLLEASCRAASAARVLWPDEQMVYIAVEASDA
jgi:hypothetical protein